MATVTGDIELIRGDTWEEDWQFFREDGQALDLTGAKLYFTLKTDPSVADVSATVRLTSSPVAGITITDAPNGKASMVLTATQSAALSLLNYYYDIQLVTAASKTYTLVKGRFNVVYDITIGTS